MAEESTGFLGRWSRRKTDILQGKPVVEPQVESVVIGKPAATGLVANVIQPAQQKHAQEGEHEVGQEVEKVPPVLSLEDVKILTKDSDFKPFMAPSVGTDVRNAAMKKLFTDPHFNVMDGLDIYIDDYSRSDPIPEAMLRSMTSSKFLKLFDDEEDQDKAGQGTAAPRENANTPTNQTVAQSTEQTDIAEPHSAPQINSSQPELLPDGTYSVASQKDHDHPDLRLQPDYAAPATDVGRGS